MTRRPRIAYLATTSWTGGAERQVHDLAVRMELLGWDVGAVSMLPLGDTFADLPALGIPTASLGMRRGFGDPRALVRFGLWLRDARPDVLHAHMVHANLLARLSRLIRPTPVVISTMHNQYQGGRWRMVAYRVTDRLSDATTAVSDVAREDAIRQGAVRRDRIFTFPNGVDLQSYGVDLEAGERVRREFQVGDRFLWLAVGRLTTAKDYPNLIAAVQIALRAGARFHVLIAGSGPDEADLTIRITAAGLGETIQLLGARADVADLMQAADGFVMSSAWEGLPMVLLEAGASGLPIVATDVGGNREAIEHERSGFLVPPRDPEALADALTRLMSLSAAERRVMGDSGRDLVSTRYDLDLVARRWDALYRRLLADRAPAPGRREG